MGGGKVPRSENWLTVTSGEDGGMSQDDVKTMQDAYDAFNRGDIPAVTEAMTSDIE